MPDNSSPNLQEKLEYLKKLVAQHPEDGNLWLRYARFLQQHFENPRKTLQAYERAQALLTSEDLRLQVGPALINTGRVEEGLDLLRAAAKEQPSAHAYCILAHELHKSNFPEEALSALATAIAIEPTFEEAYYLRAELNRVNSPKTAELDYREALRLDPEYQLAWQGLGSLLLRDQETLEQGIQALRRAVALDPEDGWSLIYLANGLWRTGDCTGADDYFRRAITAFPEEPRFREWYGQFMNSRVADQ